MSCSIGDRASLPLFSVCVVKKECSVNISLMYPLSDLNFLRNTSYLQDKRDEEKLSV